MNQPTCKAPATKLTKLPNKQTLTHRQDRQQQTLQRLDYKAMLQLIHFILDRIKGQCVSLSFSLYAGASAGILMSFLSSLLKINSD